MMQQDNDLNYRNLSIQMKTIKRCIFLSKQKHYLVSPLTSQNELVRILQTPNKKITKEWEFILCTAAVMSAVIWLAAWSEMMDDWQVLRDQCLPESTEEEAVRRLKRDKKVRGQIAGVTAVWTCSLEQVQLQAEPTAQVRLKNKLQLQFWLWFEKTLWSSLVCWCLNKTFYEPLISWYFLCQPVPRYSVTYIPRVWTWSSVTPVLGSAH